MSRPATLCLLACPAACGAAQAALGQGLSDPTRPPNTSGITEAGVDSDAPSTVLQSILLSKGRKLAIINGELVALGGKVGDGTLAEISEGQVVVKYPDRTEVLKLLGGGIERKTQAKNPGAKAK